MQKIIVFQQNGSGKTKIEGINQFGEKRFEIQTYDIDGPLPTVIDDSSPYLPKTIEADLVLDYLKHRDLSEDLSILCRKLNIPVVASGKKLTKGDAICTPTCCTLARYGCLGDYGVNFGAPEIEVITDKEIIKEIKVKRGAPCGATWHAAGKIKDMPIEDALTWRFGRPAGFSGQPWRKSGFPA